MTSTIKVTVCSPSDTSINDNTLLTPKVVDVYTTSTLPVSTPDKFSFSPFTTTNPLCGIDTVVIDNSPALTIVNNEVWRVNAIVI